MRLLMITRRIDRHDWLAGHSFEWACRIHRLLASGGGGLAVLCLTHGDISGMGGVKVYSLDERANSGRTARFLRFMRLSFSLVRASDGVFCHQNPEYAIAVSAWAILFRKRIVSWYTHKSVTWKSRVMLAASHSVLTASKESFRIFSPKVSIVGHGIDTSVFAPKRAPGGILSEGGSFRIVTIGRISPVKNLEQLIRAVGIVTSRDSRVMLHIIGAPAIAADRQYLSELQEIVVALKLSSHVRFLPSLPHDQVAAAYQAADLFVNLSRTGSIDKAVLEAMACECPVLTSNAAFRELLSGFSGLAFAPEDDPILLAGKIESVMRLSLSERLSFGSSLRRIVVEHHDLDRLMKVVVSEFS